MNISATTSSAPASHLEAGARTLVSIVFAVALIIYGIHAVLAIIYPYPLDYGEAPLVDQAMRLAEGRTYSKPKWRFLCFPLSFQA